MPAPSVTHAERMVSEKTPIDPARAQAFGLRALGILNDSFLGIGLSVGHRTGLFETLARLPPATSEQIAEATNLNERYVREWLAAMTVGDIVTYDAARDTYALPAEHAASLTRAAGPGNMAGTAQFVALLAHVETDVVNAFRDGGGVGYERFEHFHELMREDSAQVFDAALIGAILPLVAGLPEKLSAGAALADIGCGSGHAVNVLARHYAKSTITGFDIADAALAAGRAEAAEWGLTNARFEKLDVATLDLDGVFDAITAFDAVHDQAFPRTVLRAVYRALKPAGVFLMGDVAASSNLADNLEHPFAPSGYSMSYLHCMTVSLAQGGEGLGTMWGRQKALDLLAEAGFRESEVKQIDGDPFNNYFISRK